MSTKTSIKPVELMYPITTKDGRKVAKVEFPRRLTADDLIDIDNLSGNNLRTAHLIARCNGDIAPEDAATMDAADFLECGKRVEGFLEYVPPTSAKSPATSQ